MIKKVFNIPFTRSYWVIPGELAAGCYPGDADPDEAQRKLHGLIRAGIRHVISLMEEKELDRYGDLFIPYKEELFESAHEMGISVTWVRLPIRDFDIPSPEKMRTILDEIDGSILHDRPVFVHCLGGKGRTGTVVGCYLVRHGIATGEQVLDTIKQLRRNLPEAHDPSPENETQREMVRLWKVGK